MTEVFVPAARRPPPAVAAVDLIVDAPPGLPSPASSGVLPRLLPAAMAAVGTGVMAMAFASGAAVTRTPMFLAFPIMMLASAVVTAVTGRRRGGDIDADRADYLGYLSRLRQAVTENAAAQHVALTWCYPDPDALWTLIGGPRMWERGAADPDFCLVRVGIGPQPLATRLIPPQVSTDEPSDPVTAIALRRFLDTHSTIDAPITIGLRGMARVAINGDMAAARGLARAIVCQLAVSHPPDQLVIVGAIGDRNSRHWDWLKWLPHNRHPTASDRTGPVRMVYRSVAEAQHALTELRAPQVVVLADLGEGVGGFAGATTVEVGGGPDGAAVTISGPYEIHALPRPDRMDALEALVCARRLAAYRVGAANREDSSWSGLMGIDDVDRFEPVTVWGDQERGDRLRVPVGTAEGGARVELDIKEAAEGGMGPHGLCVGATGSGKSELLRTIALGMMAHNSPEVLNMLLIDFKGGATFLDYAEAPHVAAVITNLAEDAPLVARMRDALAGEMHRRQKVLRAAGCVSAAAHQRARGTGAEYPPLPTLFIIVDEFSELLSQHPDFADTFVAIGRLGRSLGVHLLLASQRLDEGRLRGLDAHLSYRMCLKTLSAAESRAVLGTLDAYELPNLPGAGYLRTGGGALIRFQAAFVSGPVLSAAPGCAPVKAPSVQLFGTQAAGVVTRAAEPTEPSTRTTLHAVLNRLSGHGPPAHQVWLPPLGSPPPLHALLRDALPAPGALTVPIGIVDRPFEQCRTPLMVDLRGAAGNVAVVGAPQSGKSTALRTLVVALAATHDPVRVQFYCLDFGGGALASMRPVPHVGAVASRAEPRLVERIVAECESLLRLREAIFAERGVGSIDEYRRLRAEGEAPPNDPFGDIFLVIDGWTVLRQEFGALEASITALAAEGLSFGVHVVLAASRWAEIRPSLRDQIGTRLELRLGDPADSEVDRKTARHVPADTAGRGLSRDGSHMTIALPVADIPPSDSAAPPIPLLPNLVDRASMLAAPEVGARILLGIDERRLQPVTLDFEQQSHLLVLGANECGKTATLRTLCREIVRTKTTAQARLVIVDFRRSLLGVVESEHLGGYAMSPNALTTLLPDVVHILQRRMPPAEADQAQLRARTWWSGPDIYLVVDDYDLVAGPAGGPLAAIADFLPYATDLGLHLVVARRNSGFERASFEPLLAGLRDLGCMTLTMSGCPGGAASFGSSRPMRLPPGRGVLRSRGGDEQVVQVAWSPP